MTCHDAREQLSDLLDEALDPGFRASIEAHLGECAECRRELERLRATVGLLSRVEPARAPVGFVDGVIQRAYPVPWYQRVGAWLFLPLSIKLPTEAAAVAVIAVLVVFLWERTPELRDAARMDPSAPTAPAPGPTVSSPAPPVPSPAPPASSTAPSQSPPASTERAARTATASKGAPAPNTSPAKAAPGTEHVASDARASSPPEASPSVSERKGSASTQAKAFELRNEATEGLRTPETAPAPVPPAGVVPPPVGAEQPARQATRVGEDRARPPESRPLMAAARSAPVAPASVMGRLQVKDQSTAATSLVSLLSQVGGSETGRRQDASGTVVEVLVPATRYDELIRGLEALGSWSAEGQPIVLPIRSPQIRISIAIY